jgi:DNA-directed RNA polymerase III subunit RPC3
LILQAEQSIGKTTSQVYEALLARVEQRLQRCKPNHDIFPNRNDADPSIPTYHIRHELDASLDTKVLTSAIGQADPNKIQLNGISKCKRKRRLDVDDEEEALVVGSASLDESVETEPDDDAEMPRALKYYNKEVAITDPVIPHLLLLAEDPTYPFCENLELQKWLVPFQPLSLSLLCKSLLSIITTRFGATSARLARILLTSPPNTPTLKLSEAQLTAKSLLPARTVRSALARMQAAQFLAIQEIPRDNQRQPSRTTYLWFFDAERVRTLVEGECYKTMSRLIQRINVEKGKSKALLDKLDRSDMKGNEDKFLTAGESQGLRKWRVMESRIWGQVGRLDEMVMVLRDF